MRSAIFAGLSAMLCASCAPQPETNVIVRDRLVMAEIDPSLLTPAPEPDREIRPFPEGLEDTGLLLVDLQAWGRGLSSQIIAIRDSLDQQRALVEAPQE